MKLQPAIGDNRRTEANFKGREPVSTEIAARGAVFDNVLAGMEGQASQPGTPAADVPSQADNPSGSSGSTSRQSATADAADAVVGSLLKRMKAKQDAGDLQASTPGAITTVDPASVAPLVLQLRAATNGTVGNGTSGTPGPSSSSGAPASVPPAEQGPARVPAGPPGDTGVVGISLATHIAPMDGAQAGRAAPSATSPSQTGASTAPVARVQDARTSTPPKSPKPGDSDARADAGESKRAAALLESATTTDRAETPQHGAAHGGDQDAPLQKSVDSPFAGTSSTIAPHQPVKSIATAIVELAAHQPSASVGETPKAQTSIARTVTLQMSPADLGTVEVRLHLSGHTLDLHLTISDSETAGLVTRERDTLATALQTQGYDLHSLVIQDGGGATSSGGSLAGNHQSSSDAGPDRRSGDSEGAQTGGHRQDQDSGRQARGGARSHAQEPPRPRGADHRSLFV